MTAASTGALGGLAAAATAWGGAEAALGVLGGGALALLNFQWLAARTAGTLAVADARLARAGWLLGSGLRLVLLAAALAMLLVSGWAHPVAVVVGLSVLPGVLVVAALAGGTEEA